MQYLCALWNYQEIDTIQAQPRQPYFAAVMLPWLINAEYELGNDWVWINASITYPCPPPLCTPANVQYIATNTYANITLPSHLQLVEPSTLSVSLGSLAPGETAFAAWQVSVDDSWAKSGQDHPIVITAQGIINGSVPDTYNYTGYSYQDAIGGTVELHY